MNLVDIAVDLTKKGADKLKSTIEEYKKLVRTMSKYSTKQLISIYKYHDGMEKYAAFKILVQRGVLVKK